MKIGSDKEIFFFYRSIVFRLTLIFVLIVSISGIVAFVIAKNSAKDQLTQVIQNQQLAFSKYIAQHIDTELNKGSSFIADLAKNLSAENFSPNNNFDNNWFQNKLVPPVFKYGVIIISNEGKLIAESAYLEGRKELSFKDQEWFQRTVKTGQNIFSKPFKSRISENPGIVFASPIRNEKKEVIAVIAGLVLLNQPELFESLYKPSNPNTSGILVISPKDKLFVASNNLEMVLMPTPEPGSNKLHDKAMQGYRGVGIATNNRGEEELSAVASIKSTGWFVVVRLLARKAYLPIKKMTDSIYKSYITIIITMVVIIIVILLKMLSPLKQAAQSVREMAKDTSTLKKLPIAYHDEVGDFTEGFNLLVDRIDERTANLEKANHDLEIKIEEVRQLSGLLPMCASCRKIRDDQGYWNNLEAYIEKHYGASFSHGMCQDCADKLYGEEDWYIEMQENSNSDS